MSQDDPRIARRTVEILNALGLHLRPADKFVGLAKQYRSEIRIVSGDREVNGKSILDLTTLAAERGTILVVEARGEDAEAALDALAQLVAARFHEDDEGQSLPGSPYPPPGRPS